MLKGAIPFFGISKNEDGRELTVQYAELKNCLINRKNHVQIRPGTNNLTIPSLGTGEEVVKNYRWKGVQKNIFLTNLGRVFEYYQVSGYTYGIIELVNLEDYIGNELSENDPGLAAGYTLSNLVKTKTNGIFCAGASYTTGSGIDMRSVFMTETDGNIVFADYDLVTGAGTDGIVHHASPCHIDYNNVAATDNVRFIIESTIAGNRFVLLYEHDPTSGAVSWVFAITAYEYEWIFCAADHRYTTFAVEYRSGYVPRFGYLSVGGVFNLDDAADIPNTAVDQPILAGVSIIDPAGSDLKVFLGMDDNYIEACTITGAFPAYVYTWSRITTLANAADYIASMVWDSTNEKLLVGTHLGKLYEASITTTAEWNNPVFTLVKEFGQEISGINHKIIGTVKYYYVGLADGMYLWKDGVTAQEELVYTPEATETNYKKAVGDYMGTTHSSGAEGYLFFNENNTGGKVYVVYPGAAETVEGYTYLTEYNVEVFETDKGRIDPSDATETEAEFLIIRFVGRLVYYKNGGGSGKVRYYYDPTVPGYTTDEIPLIESATYSDGLIIIGYQGKNRITCSRPLEFFHFDQTVYFSANYSPTPNKKLETANGLIFIFSDTDTEIWSYTPGAEHDALLGRVSVIQNGLIAKEAVAKMPGAICWLNEMRELVVSTGGEPTPLADDLIKEFHGLDNFDEALLEYVRVANLQFLIIVVPGEDVSYVYDINNNFYYEWDAFKIASFAFDIQGANGFGVIDNTLELISQGFTNDSGADIDLRIRTGFIDRDIPEHKICHQLWITYVKETTDTSLIRVRYKDKNGGDWSNYRDIPANGQGQFTSVLYALGRYQRRQWEISYTGDAGIVILEVEEHFEVLEW